MTSEINSVPVAAALAAASRPVAPAGELLKLLQPVPATVPSGEAVPAEVVALKQSAQGFVLTLRLDLAGGQQANVQVSSPQPLTQGTLLLVSQAGSDALTVAVQQVRASNLTQLDTQKVPVGTLLQAKVLTSQLLPASADGAAPAVYRSLVSVLNSAIAGATLTVDSPQPLRIASLLSAQVRASQELALVPLAGRLDQLAVAGQLASQQSRQGSLDGLLSLLQGMERSGSLAGDLQGAAQRLLRQLPDSRQMSDPRGVFEALQNSGLFMEPRLLQGLPPVDLKSALLQLVSQLQSQPAGTPAPFNPGNAASVLAQTLPGYVRSALGMLGQVGAKPQAGGFPLPARLLPALDGEGDLQHLLRMATAALSRLQSHQLASLEDAGTDAQNKLQSTWQLEIPMRHLADIVPLQVKIQREDPPADSSESRAEDRREAASSAQERIWRVELAFDLAPLGPLQVQARLHQGQLSSQLWAEMPGTAQMIAAQLGYLREKLTEVGLQVADLDCHQGLPPRGPRTHLEHRWVDENA